MKSGVPSSALLNGPKFHYHRVKRPIEQQDKHCKRAAEVDPTEAEVRCVQSEPVWDVASVRAGIRDQVPASV